MSFLRLALLSVFVLTLVGCTKLERPGVTAVGGGVTGVTNDGFDLAVDVRVTNPNDVPLPLTGVSYTVAVEGVDVFGGDAPAGTLANIPAGGEAELAVPVTIRFADLLEARDALVAGVGGGGDVSYTLNGNALYGGNGLPGVAARITGGAVPFSYSGTLPLRETLRDPRNLASDDARKLATALFSGFFN